MVGIPFPLQLQYHPCRWYLKSSSRQPVTHYYEYDTIEDEYPNSEFIKVDKILDPDGDLAPIQRFIEIQNHVIRRSQRLQERTPTARPESQMLNETFNNISVEQETEDDHHLCSGQ